ncbi:MAG: transglycosylase SLT domain-containing protein [Gemmatimonadaceae bacterium]
MVRLRRLLNLTIFVTGALACGRPHVTGVAPARTRDTAGTPAAPGAEGGATGDVASRPALPAPVPDSVREKVELAVQTLELFGDPIIASAITNSPPAATAAAPTGALPEETTWDLDVRSFITHDRVDHYVQLFTGSARDRFSSWLQRGRIYETLIRSTFRARGIPEDMYFLAAVESGYNTHAVSKAYAVGMWQFMTTTARGFGLRVDWWMDERRDPVRATDAAARFLSSLNEQFGSFYLAAAAYNGGPGRVKRGLARYADGMEERSGEDCFFALAETGYLRSETQNYVPQLIAAAYIGKSPERFGIALDSIAPYVYDSLLVPAATPLGAVAGAAHVSLAEIRDLNSFLLRGMTPPDAPMFVRVPLGRAGSADEILRVMPDSERVALRAQKARKGDTMARIAGANGMSAHQLAWYNPRLKTGKRGALTTGQVVQVPTLMVVAAAFDVPDPAIEKYGTSSRGSSRTHLVKRGESLGGLAQKYRTSVTTLVRLNHLKKRVIYPGQTIIVSAGVSRSPKAKSSSPTTKKKSASSRKTASQKKAAPKQSR